MVAEFEAYAEALATVIQATRTTLATVPSTVSRGNEAATSG